MDACNQASTGPLRDAAGPAPAAKTSDHKAPPTRRIRAALLALGAAFEHARAQRANVWDFALEAETLRRLSLSTGDLRWLLTRGWIEHAIEVTPRDTSHRVFRPARKPSVIKRSCFVLSPIGAALAEGLRVRDSEDMVSEPPGVAEPQASASTSPTTLASMGEVANLRTHVIRGRAATVAPSWDRNRRELRVGDQLVRRFTIPRPTVESILTAFEEEHWPRCIAAPLNGRSSERMDAVVQELNRGQRTPLVRFVGDEGGHAVSWELFAEPVRLEPPRLPR